MTYQRSMSVRTVNMFRSVSSVRLSREHINAVGHATDSLLCQ